MVTSAKEALDTLHSSYKGDDKVRLIRLQTLRSEFDTLKMKDSDLLKIISIGLVLLLIN